MYIFFRCAVIMIVTSQGICAHVYEITLSVPGWLWRYRSFRCWWRGWYRGPRNASASRQALRQAQPCLHFGRGANLNTPNGTSKAGNKSVFADAFFEIYCFFHHLLHWSWPKSDCKVRSNVKCFNIKTFKVNIQHPILRVTIQNY